MARQRTMYSPTFGGVAGETKFAVYIGTILQESIFNLV
jgi:hypothetical protein